MTRLIREQSGSYRPAFAAAEALANVIGPAPAIDRPAPVLA